MTVIKQASRRIALDIDAHQQVIALSPRSSRPHTIARTIIYVRADEHALIITRSISSPHEHASTRSIDQRRASARPGHLLTIARNRERVNYGHNNVPTRTALIRIVGFVSIVMMRVTRIFLNLRLHFDFAEACNLQCRQEAQL